MEVSNEFYTRSFREHFLKLIIQDRSRFDIFSPYVSLSAFPENDLRLIYKFIQEIYTSYPSIPNIDLTTLESYVVEFCLSKNLDSELYLKTLKEIFALSVNKQEDVLIDRIKKWVVRERLISALRSSVEVIKKDENPEKVLSLVKEAITTSMSVNYADMDSFDDLVEVISEERGSNVLVSTGFPSLDEYMQGGFGSGEIHVVLGNAKAGKSTFCVQLAVNNLKLNKNVVYISFELSQALVQYKFACCMTGLTYKEILQKKDLYLFRMNKFKEKFNPKLFIQKLTPKKNDIYDIKSFIQSLLTQKKIDKVDLIIIDYDKLLKPTKYCNNKYDEAEQQYIDMIELAEYFDCPIFTPAQTNREGWKLSEEGHILTSAFLSESATKKMYCNSILTLNRQGEDSSILYIDTVRIGVSDKQIVLKTELDKNRFIEVDLEGNERKIVKDIDD